MYIVIFVTTKDVKQAQKIADGLLKEKLIACANIIDGVKSLFRWEGRVDSAKEALLVLKTKKTLSNKVAAKVKLLHSYQTPEIIALPIAAGSRDYLKWIDASVRKSREG